MTVNDTDIRNIFDVELITSQSPRYYACAYKIKMLRYKSQILTLGLQVPS